MKVRRWKMFAVWTLRAEDRNRLRVFHRKCVRTMMGVSRRKQQKTHITNEELNERCKLESMDFYLRAKALRWAGHVVRMPYDRLPRKLFFGWVEHGNGKYLSAEVAAAVAADVARALAARDR